MVPWNCPFLLLRLKQLTAGWLLADGDGGEVTSSGDVQKLGQMAIYLVPVIDDATVGLTHPSKASNGAPVGTDIPVICPFPDRQKKTGAPLEILSAGGKAGAPSVMFARRLDTLAPFSASLKKAWKAGP